MENNMQLNERQQVIREQILEGNLQLPNTKIFEDLGVAELVKGMFANAWANYLKNKGTVSSVRWIVEFPRVSTFNKVLEILSSNGWFYIDTTDKRHWSELYIPEDKLLNYVTPDELANVRATKKFYKYIPSCKFKDDYSLTRVNGKTKHTGLQRIGLAKAANTQFYYDVAMLRKYKQTIIANTNKGMRKCRELMPDMVHDIASYDEVSTEIVHNLAKEPVLMTMEGNTSDSRGRAIKGALRKVANPIGYKDFRALLTIPE
jgi:hypothetical protein